MVALSVWAFDRGGGSAVGVLGLARFLPGAVALPFGAWAADRFSRRGVVTSVFLAIAVTQVLIAIALAANAPPIGVYMLVAVTVSPPPRTGPLISRWRPSWPELRPSSSP